VIAARDALAAMHLDGISDLVPTWRSLTVHFDPLRIDREHIVGTTLHASRASRCPKSRRWRHGG
jgi:allophanate hydrolase subunit 1